MRDKLTETILLSIKFFTLFCLVFGAYFHTCCASVLLDNIIASGVTLNFFDKKNNMITIKASVINSQNKICEFSDVLVSYLDSKAYAKHCSFDSDSMKGKFHHNVKFQNKAFNLKTKKLCVDFSTNTIHTDSTCQITLGSLLSLTCTGIEYSVSMNEIKLLNNVEFKISSLQK